MDNLVAVKVETLAFYGITDEQISQVLEIDMLQYRMNAIRGRVKAKLLASELILSMGLQGDTNALLAWAKGLGTGDGTGAIEEGLTKEDYDAIIEAGEL